MSDLLFQIAYLGPGGPEFMMIMLVLLVLFGAKDAPRILRKLNEIISQIRNTAEGFKREIMYSDLDSSHTPPPSDPAGSDEDSSYGEDYDYDCEDEFYEYEDEETELVDAVVDVEAEIEVVEAEVEVEVKEDADAPKT